MAEPTYEELKARLAALENKKDNGVTFKVSDKGAVSLYGLGRFPVTLYYEQWLKLLSNADALKHFLEVNKDRLKIKGKVVKKESDDDALI